MAGASRARWAPTALFSVRPVQFVGDVSYGIYLYGFPIQQAIVSQTDFVHGNGPLLFAVSAPVVILFALVSWLWIEKPFLAVKPYVLGQKQWRKRKAPALAPAE